jgi:hypothetical protein
MCINKLITISKSIPMHFKSLASLLLVFIMISSCKKEEPIVPSGFEFFVPNKGMKMIWSEKSSTVGLESYNVGHFSLSSDGHINTLYTFVNFAGTSGNLTQSNLARKKINLQTGVATDGIKPPTATYAPSFEEEDGNFTLINNTNYLAYYDTYTLKGDAPWLPIQNVDIAYPIKVYENAQILSSYYLSFNNTINASYMNNGTFITEAKVFNGPNYCHSLDQTAAGTVLLFMAGYNSLQVYDFSTNTLLASVPVNIYNAYSSFAPQYTIMKTRRSLDGTKIIGMIQEKFQAPVHTGFIYDIASNSFDIKFDAIARVGGYHTSAVDFDENANIYYPAVINNYQIRKISPSGDNIFLQDFITVGYIKKLRCAGTKLITALSEDGNGFYSDDRGKAKLVIATTDL